MEGVLPRVQAQRRQRRPFGPREKVALQVVTLWLLAAVYLVLSIANGAPFVIAGVMLIVQVLSWHSLDLNRRVRVLRDWWESEL